MPSQSPPTDAGPSPVTGSWPQSNQWSWDGSWTPSQSDFPIPGLLDNEYFDGHNGSPILPPGAWDWADANNDLANWRNFEATIGRFERLMDNAMRQYGWRLIGNTPAAIDLSGPVKYFEGSPGTDVINLGSRGVIHSYDGGDLGNGPDVLVFNKSYLLDLRTGSTAKGTSRDNDLVVAGCDSNPNGSWDINTTTIHTGPGRDWVFVRDFDRSAIDLGNGNGGRTDTLDPNDSGDLVVVRGNTHDFRVFGGAGSDVAVWYVDDNVQTTSWLGPNFFGGGGADPVLWNDSGTDRLVLAVPSATQVVATNTPTQPGQLRVVPNTGSLALDDPTQQDPFARYCVTCGTGPGGRKTMILEYVSADGHVRTGYFYVTAFEEIQIGVGSGARVLRIDDVNNRLEPIANAVPSVPPAWPMQYCTP